MRKVAGFCNNFHLGKFSIFNDSDEDIIIIYTDNSEQVFLGLQWKKKRILYFISGTNPTESASSQNQKKTFSQFL